MNRPRVDVRVRYVLPVTDHRVDPAAPPPWGWVLWIGADGHDHIAPTWDIRSHQLTEHCRCCPALDAWGVMAHNAFDGRERYEQGSARRH